MKCPICHQETTWQNNPTRPFCSERCQLMDLGKWADGDYRISGNPISELDKDAADSLTEISQKSKSDFIN